MWCSRQVNITKRDTSLQPSTVLRNLSERENIRIFHCNDAVKIGYQHYLNFPSHELPRSGSDGFPILRIACSCVF